jgi:flagellar motility protein MotE (MotC chaperone)
MKMRPTLLMLTAAAAGASVLANGASAADPAASRAPETRLGASIKQDVAKRDQETARRNRALELREQAARAAEQRLQTKKGGEDRPDRTAPRDVEEERFTELARIYQSMRPARAAVVFEQLEMDVQVNVARRMRERSTALILANMAPQKAAALTMAMARLPQPKKQIPRS